VRHTLAATLAGHSTDQTRRAQQKRDRKGDSGPVAKSQIKSVREDLRENGGVGANRVTRTPPRKA
jgi:hypothetical protein